MPLQDLKQLQNHLSCNNIPWSPSGYPKASRLINEIVWGEESDINKNGVANLAPYSYFNAVADEPPQVMFCSNGSSTHGKYKDSLSNILYAKEFVVNFATSTSRNQMNISSRDFKPDEDEFILSNLKKKKSRLVKPQSVKNSPVNLECKLPNFWSNHTLDWEFIKDYYKLTNIESPFKYNKFVDQIKE